MKSVFRRSRLALVFIPFCGYAISSWSPQVGRAVTAAAPRASLGKKGSASSLPGRAPYAPLAAVDLATIISGPETAVVGQTVYYLATTTNGGDAAATGAVVTIQLPANLTTVNATNGSYDINSGLVTFTSVSLAIGAKVTNSVSFVATAATATGQAASTSTPSDANASNNNGSAAAANLATATTPTGAAGRAAPCATAGKDGSLTITTNPNAYYPSTASQTLAPNATTIAVGAATGAATNIAPGDLLLVIQMQGADFDATNTDSYGDGRVGGSATGSSVTTNFTAGTYEYVKVATSSAMITPAAGGTITLATGLVNGYLNAPATTTTGQRTFQVVRIPQYANLTLGATISPLPWNGSTGGIIALDIAGQFSLGTFTLDASGTGFRGGGRGACFRALRQLRATPTRTTVPQPPSP